MWRYAPRTGKLDCDLMVVEYIRYPAFSAFFAPVQPLVKDIQ